MTICSLYNKDCSHTVTLWCPQGGFDHVVEVAVAIFVKYFRLPVKSQDLLFVRFSGSRLGAARHLVLGLRLFVGVKVVCPQSVAAQGRPNRNLLILGAVVVDSTFGVLHFSEVLL